MSNFHALEMDVIRWAESTGQLECVSSQTQAVGILSTVTDLYDAIVTDEPIVEISDAMGRVAIDMIVLCAMLDIDLSKCLESAFNKIKAKP